MISEETLSGPGRKKSSALYPGDPFEAFDQQSMVTIYRGTKGLRRRGEATRLAHQWMLMGASRQKNRTPPGAEGLC